MSEYANRDLTIIITPVNVNVLHNLLVESKYDTEETRFLVEGFKYGFDLEYQGPWKRQDQARNIPFQVGVGSKEDLWSKIMKEVKAGRYAGPYDQIPYRYFVQSPIGLVPKSGNKTRLIFHLSYDFKEFRSINAYTPQDLCTVKYNDIEHAVLGSLRLIEKQPCDWPGVIYYSKTDLMSTFRILPLKRKYYRLLIMKTYHPVTKKLHYFVEKNLPFRHSILCCHFQCFSNGLRHIFEFLMGDTQCCTCYLDDFLFYCPSRAEYNQRVSQFLDMCKTIGVPVALEKTEWATSVITFLGVNFHGQHKILTVPEDKKQKALSWIHYLLQKRTATMKQLEQITGLLNFLGRVIVPGRAFTHRMYARYTGAKNIGLKQHHHVTLNAEFKDDCRVWETFLNKQHLSGISRPFIDFSDIEDEDYAEILQLTSDATANARLEHGGHFRITMVFPAMGTRIYTGISTID